MDFFFEDHTKNPFEKYMAFLEADDEEGTDDKPVSMEVNPDKRLHNYKDDVEADETISPDTASADGLDTDDTDLTPNGDDGDTDAPAETNQDTSPTTDDGGSETNASEPDTGDDTSTDDADTEGNGDDSGGEAGGDDIDVGGEEDDLSVDDDAPDETGGEDTDTTGGEEGGAGKKERTDESLLKYSLFLDMKNLYNAIKSYYTRLEDINGTNINYGMVTKTCATNLHRLEDMVYDFMTIRFIDESYVTCKLFYEKVITSIGLIFDMLEQNAKLVN